MLNKNFLTKSRWQVTIILLLSLGIGQMWAGISVLSFTSSSATPNDGTSYNDDQSNSWTINHDSDYKIIDGDAIHVGSSSKTCSYLKATSSAFSGVTVTSVIVNAKQNGTGSVNVTINNSAFGGDAQSLTNSYEDYTFTGSVAVTGNIVANLSRASATKKNFFLKTLTVTYLTAITLNKNGGSSNGSVKYDHDASSYATSSFTAVTRDGYTCTGYWTASSGGTKILNANGTLAGASITVSSVPYTSSSTKWAYAGKALTLYAQWESAATKLGTINGSINMTSSTDGTVTISDWTYAAGSTGTTESNVSSYTVKLYKLTAAPSTWTIVSGSTSGGASGTQGTRTGITTASKSVTYSGLEYGATYRFSVQAIGNGSTYTNGDETYVTSINGNSLTDNKFLNKYSIYMDDGTNSDAGWAHHWVASLTSHTGSVTLESLNANINAYKFKLTLGGVIWYSADGTLTSSNCTNWTLYDNESNNCGLQTNLGGDYVFAISTNGSEKVSVTYPPDDQTSGKNIYFDNSVLNWSNIYYRVGSSSTNVKEDFTLVTGTDNFYYTTTPSKDDISAWHIANNTGWTGSNDIYKTNTGDSYAITKSIAFQQYVVTGHMTIIPTTTSSKGSEDKNNNCDFYTINTPTSGMLTHTATITAPSNGTISLAYTDVSGTSQNKTSTTAGLAHRTKITATATPNTGYHTTSFTVTPSGGVATALTSGATDNHILAKDATFAATFAGNVYTITYKDKGNVAYSGAVTAGVPTGAPTTHTYGNATALVNGSKSGYTFDGWHTDASCTISAGSSLGATAYTDNITLYALWTESNYTVTLNDEGGSGGSGSKTVTYNHNTNLTSNVAVPTKAGFDFRGYYTSAGGGGTKVINGAGAWITGTAYVNAGGNWIGTSNIELHAYWTATTYNNYRTTCSTTAKVITINNLAGGTVTTSPSGSAEPGDVVTITLAAATHYNVGGAPTVVDEDEGSVSVSGSGTTYTFTMPDKDVTITPAAWSPINVTIYWHRKTGTTPEEVLEGTSDKTFPNTTDVDAECAPFTGWIAGTTWTDSYDAPATTYAAGATVPTVNADVHYTAIYREKVTAIAPAYIKMTAAPKSWINEHYLIVYEGDTDRDSVAFDGRRDNDTYGSIDAARDTVKVKIVDGVIAKTSRLAAAEWKIDTLTDGKHSIQSASGYYIGQTSDANGMLTSKSTAYQNTLAYSSGSFSVTSSGAAVLRYNKASDQLRFRYFKTTSYSSQQAIQLYKLGEAEVNTYTYTKNPACTPRYRVTVSSATGGSPSADPIYTPADESVTLTANPSAGYSFTGWTITHTEGGAAASVTYTTGSASTETAVFTMPDYDVTVTATYAKIYVTSVVAKDGETVLNTTDSKLNVHTGANKTVTVVVTPANAYDHSWSASVTAGGTYASISDVTDNTFRVNGLLQGDATIVVTAPNDDGADKTATFTVHVTDVLPEEIILKRDGSVAEIEELTMYYDAANSRGQYVKVNVSYSPTPTNKNFSFSSAATGKVGSHSHSNVNLYEVLVANGVTSSPVNCTFTSAADGSVTKVLAVTVLPLLTDRFVDYIQGNATQTRTAALSADRYSLLLDITTPTLDDADDSEPSSADCKTAHYHLIGWLPQTTAEALWAAGTAITESTEGLVPAGTTVEASGQTWCAIWAKEE